MNTNKNKMEICTLEFLGNKYFGKDITEEEIRKIDITTIFEEEMKKHIENKELINMAIIGNVTKGKSTVMLKIVQDINKLLGRKMSLDLVFLMTLNSLILRQ